MRGSVQFSASDTSCLFPVISSSMAGVQRSRVGMSPAVYVQLKGFGFPLCCARQ
jgi:hypothetical protein